MLLYHSFLLSLTHSLMCVYMCIFSEIFESCRRDALLNLNVSVSVQKTDILSYNHSTVIKFSILNIDFFSIDFFQISLVVHVTFSCNFSWVSFFLMMFILLRSTSWLYFRISLNLDFSDIFLLLDSDYVFLSEIPQKQYCALFSAKYQGVLAISWSCYWYHSLWLLGKAISARFLLCKVTAFFLCNE